MRVSEPQVLPILPIRNVVILPKSIIPVIVGRESSLQAIDAAMKHYNKEVFASAQTSPTTENPTPRDIFMYGTRAQIVQVVRMPNGSLKILLEGVTRARVAEFDTSGQFLTGMIEDLITEPLEVTPKNQALWRNLLELFKSYMQLNDRGSDDIMGMFKDLSDLDLLTDTVAVQLWLDVEERQKILETVDLKERTLKLCTLLQEELEIAKADQDIKNRVQSQVEQTYKKHYLTEQMRAIQKELGKDGEFEEAGEYIKKAKKLKVSNEALEKIKVECKRLEQMHPMSPEAPITRSYIELILSLPWNKSTKDNVDLAEAQKILDSSHAGMKRPKERIIEFLAAKKFAGESLKRTPIVCLAGPPGVGKTSLAQSIADSLGRKLVRIALGGLRDEAEIRGHRKTYIGSMPGKIIKAMQKSGVSNPVILLDEVDKMASDFRGDPASALLEVLDPEQNKAFSDHYLELDYDLSHVMFLTTANVTDNIPLPLLDRMEVIPLAGYTSKEKYNIAREFLLPKLYSEHSLQPGQVVIETEALISVIEDYTKEAGVRQLERMLAKIVRKSIQELLLDKDKKSILVDKQKTADWLRVPEYKRHGHINEERVGTVIGLAWMETGGDILEIEATVVRGKGGLSLTGQLGEVMQESGQAALSYIRSRAKELGLSPTFYTNHDVHVHVSEGAIPKDGPSAGIAIALALTSALTKIPVKKNLALTGEITLRGNVLGVGGLKEKLLAASRFSITTALVPLENKRDIEEFITELDPSLTIIYVRNVQEVYEHGLIRMPHEKKKRKKSLHTTLPSKKTSVKKKKKKKS